MSWRDPLKRAWRETLVSLGVSDFSLLRVLRSTFVSSVFVIFIWFSRGDTEAMTEVSEIALYVLAFVAAAFLPTFVWNVWIAPYRLLKEQVDELHQAFGRSHRAVSPATHFNVADWESVRVFQLGDAACLWVGVEPHSPISDPRASAMFKRLSGEIVEGRLQCSRGWAGLSNLMGGDPWWPKHQQHVSAIALRRYADAVGEAPTFLESVVVPVEEEPVEEEEDRSIPDPDRSNALVSTDEK